MLSRSLPEVLEKDELLGWRGQLDVTRLPERFERRQPDTDPVMCSDAAIIDRPYPVGFGTGFNELVPEAEAFRQVGEDLEVVARLMQGRYRLMHRQDESVA